MSLVDYKIIHITGILFLFFGIGSILLSQSPGGSIKGKAKVIAFASHGIGLLILMVSGFGLLAKLGLTSGLPGWAYLKLGVWALLGLAVSLAKRKANWTLTLTILFVGLGVSAAALGLLKPF